MIGNLLKCIDVLSVSDQYARESWIRPAGIKKYQSHLILMPCMICIRGDSMEHESQELMMVDRIDILNLSIQMQLSTIETGYIRATMERLK